MTPQKAADILGLRPPWTAESIKKAFKKRSRETHPDRNGSGNDAAFKRVSTARDTLTAHLKKQQNRGTSPFPQRSATEDRLRPRRPQTGARARRQDWNSGWYDTGDARARAARGDPYFRNRQRVDPRHHRVHVEPEPEDDESAKAGDWYIVGALSIGEINIDPSTVKAQLQHTPRHGYVIAIYLSIPLPVVSGDVTIILAEDSHDDAGSLFRKPVASRAYNKENLVTTLWFHPF